MTVSFDENPPFCPMSVGWSYKRKEASHFTFKSLEPGHFAAGVVHRWTSMLNFFEIADRLLPVDGETILNLNDAGVDAGLAFCGNGPEYTLIPDFLFVRSQGYAVPKTHFHRNIEWSQRSNVVFWRGSSLGQKNKPIMQMPRVQLCEIVRGAEESVFDVGFSELLDISPEDAGLLRSQGFEKDHVSWQSLDGYKYHVDIDGHACSYAGLFRKLLSGGVVLKVKSPYNHSQWYYERLEPWVNYIPVRSDLSDLLDLVSYCRTHDKEVQRIARAGRALALSLTFEREVASGINRVARAFLSGTKPRKN
jgi:hypothetical protein